MHIDSELAIKVDGHKVVPHVYVRINVYCANSDNRLVQVITAAQKK